MKAILLLFLGSLFIAISGVAQIVPNGNSGSTSTSYTNGSPNDPIHIWCADGLSSTTASLTANPPTGTGPWTFDWFFHNEINFSWAPYTSTSGTSSTISNLASDGYRVQIYDSGNNLVGCYTAWVWNMNGQVTASQNPTACDATALNGTVSANGSFTYYNPPPPESLINASTQISVCFSATHTYVSDLAYYLVGPASCGSPTILLAPNPGAVGFNSTCNSGDNVNNLCFTTSSTNIYNVCGASTPLTGTFGGYATSASGNQMINWSPLYGCNAAQGGWAVQIYDCISQDVGFLTNATISFSNLTSICGSPTTITYNSGAISSAINDNSCTAASASIFQVPISNAFSTPITINATTSYLWTSNQAVTIPNASTSLSPTVTGIPTGTTTFTLTATVSHGGVSCQYEATADFVNTCCTAIADAGSNISFCTGDSGQLGVPAVNGMTYSWSPSNGLSDESVAQPTVTLTNGGTSPQNFTYTLTVTNVLDGGCTATDDVTVTVNPLPTVSAGTYDPVCASSSEINLSGTPSGGTFSGEGITGNTFSPSAGTQVIIYSYEDVNGCSNSASTTITVNNNPIVSAGSYAPACEDGGLITLEGSPEGGTFSGIGVTGTNFDPSANTQTITYTFTDVNGCLGSDQITIIVNQLPSVDAGTFGPFCQSDPSVVLIGSPSGGTYSGIGVTDNTFSPSFGTQTITYSYTDLNGCTNSSTTEIIVTPMPDVQAGSYSPVCINADNILLNGTPSGGVFSGIGVDGNMFEPSAGTQTITYTYTDANGCAAIANTIITVNNLPNVSAGVNQTICIGATVTLSGSGATSYQWSGGVMNGIAFIPEIGNNYYVVIGTDQNGCQASDTVWVNTLPLPVANVNSDTTIGYPIFTIEIENNSTNATTYYWNFDNGATGTTFETGIQTGIYTEPGTYLMTLIADNGYCTDSDTLVIIVLPFPDPIIHLPNVFTPNGDGNNDLFYLQTQYVEDLDLFIVNRWGNVVFQSTPSNLGWDGLINGNEAAEGVYFFRYRATGINGIILEGHGNVTLIR
jgi:trimeric autotransporter adhesin